ncbi:hypothetical protein EYF80_024703 [Liparis tanakae]|uniref:Uncharacterized protein n=1 Tax=Liparis tanakae TaxID=230148 RepID=A0A4Z2HJI1_9TELE|nr:hypothetical protein EYF80_024703 [Liparis tanakae]
MICKITLGHVQELAFPPEGVSRARRTHSHPDACCLDPLVILQLFHTQKKAFIVFHIIWSVSGAGWSTASQIPPEGGHVTHWSSKYLWLCSDINRKRETRGSWARAET